MIDFFQYGNQTNINFNQSEQPIIPLLGIPNEVWTFEIDKSTLQKNCKTNASLWWYAETYKDKNTCIVEQKKFIEKAGNIDLVNTEKYGTVSFEVNGSLVGKHFSISSEGYGLIFNYLAIDGTIDDLLRQIIDSEAVFEAINEGNEITLKICGNTCGQKLVLDDGIYADTNDAPNGLASIDLITETVNCNCADKYLLQVKLPCEEGCFNLAIKIGNELEPFAMTIPISVSNSNIDKSVFIRFGESGFRIIGDLRFNSIAYETTERGLSSGSFSRDGYKAYDVYKLSTPFTDLKMQRYLLQILNDESVRINGKKLYVKAFEQTPFRYGEFNSTYTLYDLDTLINTNIACYSNLLSNVEIVNNTNQHIETITLKDGKLVNVFDKNTYLQNDKYCFKIVNSSLAVYEYQIIKDGLITNIDGEIKPKCKKFIPLNICDCKHYKIIVNEKGC